MQRKATGSEKGRGPDHVTEMIPIDGRARQEGAVLRRVHPLATAYTLSARKFTFTAYCLSGSKPLGKSFRDVYDSAEEISLRHPSLSIPPHYAGALQGVDETSKREAFCLRTSGGAHWPREVFGRDQFQKSPGTSPRNQRAYGPREQGDTSRHP